MQTHISDKCLVAIVQLLGIGLSSYECQWSKVTPLISVKHKLWSFWAQIKVVFYTAVNHHSRSLEVQVSRIKWSGLCATSGGFRSTFSIMIHDSKKCDCQSWHLERCYWKTMTIISNQLSGYRRAKTIISVSKAFNF